MGKLIIEALGAFFLVLTIGLTAFDPKAGAMAPLAIGSMLMVMIFAGGHVSGAHYNPAVSTAVFVRKKMRISQLLTYVIAQVVGAYLGAAMVLSLKTNLVLSTINPPVVPALLCEFLFTFALCFVVLNVATAKGTSGNPTYGLAIGFTVIAGAYAVGGISGGSFNPAVSIALASWGILPLALLIKYLVVQIAAGIAAAKVFKICVEAD